jgi:murein DD-endopeptidase MepM/ murein hydrolase activator NlpD
VEDKQMRKFLSALVLAVTASFAVAGTTAAHWPVANRYSYVTQWYSTRHRAIDIGTYCGTPIKAAGAGRTVFAGWKNNGGGYQVLINHGNGVYTGYYHMRKEVSYAGEYISIGETIGYVGQTGNATGCHLHVERWHGYPWRSGSYRVNPWSYIDHGYWFPYRYR